MDHAAEMLELIKRYKGATKGSAVALASKAGVSSHIFLVDQMAASLRRLRLELGQAVASDSALLLTLQSREAQLASELDALDARRRRHVAEKASALHCIALSNSEAAKLIGLARTQANASTVKSGRVISREASGALASLRMFTASLSHRVDPSCTGTLPAGGTARALVRHAHTLEKSLGPGGPTFSPMRPKGGSAPKAGGLIISGSKGGGLVHITSAVSQGARLALQEEAGRLGYRSPEDREYARITAPARQVSIKKWATGI